MTIKAIDATTLKSKLENHEDVLLIDVREADEWHAGRIPGAQFMPLSDFENEVKKLDGKQNTAIILQCRSGVRSMRAAQYLESLGYLDLTNLTGGILGWHAEGYDIITD